MADQQPQDVQHDDNKKDTVRINLPTGVVPKTTATMPTPTVRLRPASAPGTAPTNAPVTDESKIATATLNPPTAPTNAKKDTAAITPPAATPKAKKDTSRVQPAAAKPTVPEMPRPTVRLKREETPVPATVPPDAAPTMAPASAPAAVAAGGVTSLIDVGLALAAMVVALAVAGYLYQLSHG